MRLVSEPLEEVESGICSSEADRIGSVWTKNDLFTFRQRSKGYIGHTDVIERTSGSAELTLPAIHDQKIREWALLIHPALEIPGDDLRHRTVIVVSPISLDAHVPVFALLRCTVLEHHGASDRIRSLMMADIEAHDETGDDLEVEPVS